MRDGLRLLEFVQSLVAGRADRLVAAHLVTGSMSLLAVLIVIGFFS